MIEYESNKPTQADIEYDSYIRSILINTARAAIRRIKPIDDNEISIDNVIENQDCNLVREDEYEFERSVPNMIFENDQEYKIDSPDLYCALKELKPIERQTILLSVFNGYTDREIEQILKVPRRTIASRRLRIIGKIRTALIRQRNKHGA